MTADYTTIVRRHVEAITHLLIGNRSLKPGTAIAAGEPIEIGGIVRLAQLAKESRTDLVYLHFDQTKPGSGLRSITLVMMRNGICYCHTDCRLYLSKSGTRAVILPQNNVRGLFRLSPREVIHIDRKPNDVEDGVARADAQMRKLVERGVCLEGRAETTSYPQAA